MTINRGLVAFFRGLRLCFAVSKIRRLALLPWLLGLLSYPLALYAAYSTHEPLMDYLISAPEGFLSTILYWLTWIGATLVLFVAAMFASVLTVLICTAAFQTAIVEEVLRHERESTSVLERDEGFSLWTVMRQSAGAILTESIKLIWLVPLLVIAFILGLFPLLTPFAFLLASWLLAFQFLDIVLDVARFSATQRIHYTARHWLSSCSFGLIVTIVFLIPFAGIFLGPVATAGAAWMLAQEEAIWKETPVKGSTI